MKIRVLANNKAYQELRFQLFPDKINYKKMYKIEKDPSKIVQNALPLDIQVSIKQEGLQRKIIFKETLKL